jgi:hypothetical protein
MAKLSKDKNGYYKITISPDAVCIFNLQEGRTYDWNNVNGFPALQERKK